MGRSIHCGRLESGRIGCNRHGARRTGHAFAIERQAHRDTGALARPALDLDLAAMELDEPLDDRQPETAAVVLARVGAARLEERIADAREIVRRDTDAG